MRCRDAQEKLSAYLDGELPLGAGAAVREHLASCRECAAALERLQRLPAALDALEGMRVPLGFAARVRAEAVIRAAQPAPLFTGRLARVAAVLVAAVGLTLGAAAGESVTAPEPLAIALEAAEADEFDLQVDPLSTAPAGSVAEAFLALASETE